VHTVVVFFFNTSDMHGMNVKHFEEHYDCHIHLEHGKYNVWAVFRNFERCSNIYVA
jgi:hypothetical protein